MRDRYAVVGHPIAHSRSPEIHTAFALATGQALDYGRIEAPLDGFERSVEAFRAAGGKGVNVTLPFKEAAYRYSNHLSERARRAKVVNTLAFRDGTVYGDNTDGVGLVADIVRNLRIALSGKTLLLVGAGGAAQGVIPALLEAGVSRLVIANRTAARARTLAELHAVAGMGLDEAGRHAFDIVVNATSAGLANGGFELAPSVFKPGALAYDMVYGRDTAFLAQARAAGARTADGLGMLVEQAAESFLVWRGVRPGTRAVLETMRAR